MRSVTSQARASAPDASSPDEVARVIADAVTIQRPRARYTVGRGTATIVRATRLLSDRMLYGLLARGLKTYTSSGDSKRHDDRPRV